jgi:hypothetical protein
MEMSDKERLRALSDLIQTPGWKLFCEHLEAKAMVAQNSAFAAKDAHDAAKNIGAYNALRFLAQWPVNTAQQYQAAQRKETLHSSRDDE